MWFLWFIITFFVVIASGSQITKVIVNKNERNAVATVTFSIIMAVAWLIISVSVSAIRAHWSALLVGWILALIGTAISANLNKNKPQSNQSNSIFQQIAKAQNTAKKLNSIVNDSNHFENFTKSEIAGGLVNLLDAKSKLTPFEYMCIQKLLSRFESDNSQKMLNHEQYLEWCNEMISHFDMVAPYYKYCGDGSMEFLGSLLDDDKKSFRVKAKRLLENGKLFGNDNWSFSNEWSKLNYAFKKEFYDEDTTQIVESLHGNANAVNKINELEDENADIDEKFIVTEEELEQLVDVFNNDIICVNEIIEEMDWHGQKAKGFLNFISLMGYVDIDDNIDGAIVDDDWFDENPNALIINKDSIQELIDELPVEIDESNYDEDWYKELHETLQELIEEMAPKNKSEYSLNDIDLMLGKSFCCIRHKPDGLCQDIQDAIKECAKSKYKTKKAFTMNEVKNLVKLAFIQINAQDDEGDDTVEIAQDEQTDDTLIGFMGMPMNEKIFSEQQGQYPWFTPSVFDSSRKSFNVSNLKEGELSWDETCMTIFGNIFGGYGIKKNLKQAYDMTVSFFDWAKQQMPTPDVKDEKYVSWLKQWGDMNIIMGTIYAYQNEYVKASYHFMNGLKTEMVNINSPYCDFIRYILKKLDVMPKEKANYLGCGFSKDNPMGSLNGRMLIADKAMEIIPEMEGNNGETIIAKGGRTGFYGHLVRRGSTSGSNGMIDIYETYVIDSKYNLMNVELFFNGYFNSGVGENIKIAKGFRIKPNSSIINRYRFS